MTAPVYKVCYRFKKVCSECSSTFETNLARKKTCSDECSKIRNNRLTKINLKVNRVENCKHCDKEFKVSREHRHYCSDDCKEEHRYLNRTVYDNTKKLKLDEVYRSNFKPLIVPSTKKNKSKKYVIKDIGFDKATSTITKTLRDAGVDVKTKKHRFRRQDGQLRTIVCNCICLKDIECVIAYYNDKLSLGYNASLVQTRNKWFGYWKILESMK